MLSAYKNGGLHNGRYHNNNAGSDVILPPPVKGKSRTTSATCHQWKIKKNTILKNFV